MGLRDDGEVSSFPVEIPGSGSPLDAIPSLNEAWFHTLGRCLSGSPLSDVILPRFLVDPCTRLSCCRGVIASDITGFIMEEPQS
jgi:hypothetical protein